MEGRPIEICAVWGKDGEIQKVQDGIYVFNTTTLQDVYELLTCYEERNEPVPDRFEIRMDQFGRDKE